MDGDFVLPAKSYEIDIALAFLGAIATFAAVLLAFFLTNKARAKQDHYEFLRSSVVEPILGNVVEITEELEDSNFQVFDENGNTKFRFGSFAHTTKIPRRSWALMPYAMAHFEALSEWHKLKHDLWKLESNAMSIWDSLRRSTYPLNRISGVRESFTMHGGSWEDVSVSVWDWMMFQENQSKEIGWADEIAESVGQDIQICGRYLFEADSGDIAEEAVGQFLKTIEERTGKTKVTDFTESWAEEMENVFKRFNALKKKLAAYYGKDPKGKCELCKK